MKDDISDDDVHRARLRSKVKLSIDVFNSDHHTKGRLFNLVTGKIIVRNWTVKFKQFWRQCFRWIHAVALALILMNHDVDFERFSSNELAISQIHCLIKKLFSQPPSRHPSWWMLNVEASSILSTANLARSFFDGYTVFWNISWSQKKAVKNLVENFVTYIQEKTKFSFSTVPAVTA